MPALTHVRKQVSVQTLVLVVALAVAAAEHLSAAGRGVRVVSMPCTQLFDAQEAGYREAVLPSDVLARVAVEAGHADFWYKYVGLEGKVLGIDRFGISAPGNTVMAELGMTGSNVVSAAG